MLTSIKGAWELKTGKNSPDREILYIYPDGRLVQFMHSRGYKHDPLPVPFKIRIFPDGEGKFRIKAKAKTRGGWAVEVQDEGMQLVIEPPRRPTVVWHRVSRAELPDWFARVLPKVRWD